MTGGSPTSADDLLDFGAQGLTYFADFLPLLEQSGTRPSSGYLELCARHDQQRGLRFDVVEQDAARLRDAADAALAEVDRQRECRIHLSAGWAGDAAQSALDLLDRQIDRSEIDAGTLDAVATAIESACPALRSILEDKCAAAAEFARPDVGGRDRHLVAGTVAGATRPPAQWSADEMAALQVVLPGLGETLLSATPHTDEVARDVVDRVAAECRAWLDSVFVPAVTDRVRAFEELCARTDSAVADVYRAVSTTLDDVGSLAYPTPTDANSADAPAPVATHPSSTASAAPPVVQPPDGPPVSTACPAAVTPPPVAPEPSVAAPACGKDGDVTGLGDVVADVVRGVLSAPEVADVPLTDDQPAAAESPSATNYLDAAVDGHRLRVDAEADGTLDVTTWTPGGDSRHWEIGIGPWGVPEMHEVAPPNELPHEPEPAGGEDDGVDAATPDPAPAAPDPAAPEPAAPEPAAPEPAPPDPAPPEPSAPEPEPSAPEPDCTPDAVPAPEPAPHPDAASHAARPAEEPARPELAEAGPM